MKLLLALCTLALSILPALAAPRTPDVIPAKGGNIVITPIYHGSLQIEYRGTVIHVDPFTGGDYTGTKKADVILITHTHSDHLDFQAFASQYQAGSVAVMPLAVQNEFIKRERSGIGFKGLKISGLKNGQKTRVERITVEAVPMYNLVRGPKPGQKFHPKGEFNGYLLTLGGKRIYIAGDTEATPEMKALKNIDVAFLPMNLPYTMTPQEAAEGARGFKPRIVFPYHYRSSLDTPNNSPQQFAKALEGTGIEVRLRGWYDRPASR